MTAKTGYTYKYDGENRLVEVRNTSNVVIGSYTYNERGLRIRKTEGTVTTYYGYMGDKCVYQEEYTGTEQTKKTAYIYVGNQNLAELNLQTNTYTYKLLDHLGSTRAVLDSDGAIQSTVTYGTFGEKSDGAASDYRFTDKELDSGTGLVYFNARYYDPTIGRFITEDPAKDGINWYVYCENNPLNRHDPDGKVWNFIAGAAIGAVISAGVDVLAQAANAKINGMDFSWDWKGTAAAALGGAVAGLTTSGVAVGASLVRGAAQVAVLTAGGAVAGAAGSGVSTVTNNASNGVPLTQNLGNNVLAGAIGGAAVSYIVGVNSVVNTGGVGLLPPTAPQALGLNTERAAATAFGKQVFEELTGNVVTVGVADHIEQAFIDDEEDN